MIARCRICPRLSLLGSFWLLGFAAVALAQPTPHHTGAWTPRASWPGAPSVQAVHLALLRGDTVFARPHSLVMAWGPWNSTPADSNRGGLWEWGPSFDGSQTVPANLTRLPIAPPSWTIFCAGAATVPNGDLVVVGGHERSIVGEARSMRFNRETRTWGNIATMSKRRWFRTRRRFPMAN